MLALVLRMVVLLVLVALAFLWPALVAQVGMPMAVLAVLVLAAAAPLMLTALAYAFAAAAGPGVRIGLRGLAGEALALAFAFLVTQPFERWVMGSDAVGRLPPGSEPVLLVHGYMCNRGLWWWFRRELRRCGLAVATISLETPVSPIDTMARQLSKRIDALLAETGAGQVAIVAHSMGGLVTRALLGTQGDPRIARFVTLAGPHHGTAVALLGLGENARQMRPGSAFLAGLPPLPPDLPTLSVWSVGDEIIAPPSSSRLGGADETVLSGLGHVAMVFSPAVLDRVAAALAAGRR